MGTQQPGSGSLAVLGLLHAVLPTGGGPEGPGLDCTCARVLGTSQDVKGQRGSDRQGGEGGKAARATSPPGYGQS